MSVLLSPEPPEPPFSVVLEAELSLLPHAAATRVNAATVSTVMDRRDRLDIVVITSCEFGIGARIVAGRRTQHVVLAIRPTDGLARDTGSRTRTCRWREVPELRRPHLDLDDAIDPTWNEAAPEFVAAANAVSLLMPFVEPWFASSVRRSIPHLDARQASIARVFVRQELEHQRKHRRFNHQLVTACPGLRRPQRRTRQVYSWLARTRSLRFGLAFAAASETIAYSLARWTSDHLAEFLRGADPVAVDLFVWHLAEEVEHKSVAFDAWMTVDGSRWRYVRAGALSLVLLAWFSLWSIIVMLHAGRRLHLPTTWWRLGRLVFSFTFEVIPTMFVSSLPGHHPDQLTDPDWYAAWLVDFEIRRGLRVVADVDPGHDGDQGRGSPERDGAGEAVRRAVAEPARRPDGARSGAPVTGSLST